MKVTLRRPHEKQKELIESRAKRKVVRVGRRGGKTTGLTIPAIKAFLDGKRVLYATPTDDQVNKFWFEVKHALQEPLSGGVFHKNETKHIIELQGTEQRIRAKTAWNADTLRGDYADLLILDEFQDMDISVWNEVGAPMLLDNNGNAIFSYTQKLGRKHIKAFEEKAKKDESGKWSFFHWTSFDNPYISQEALEDITDDMTSIAYKMEIMAEDCDDVPGALWKREWIKRVSEVDNLSRVVVGVDPSGGGNDECGIVVAGMKRLRNAAGKMKPNIYTLADLSLHGSSAKWARKVVSAYHEYQANYVVAEKNFGGDMVGEVIKNVDSNVPVKLVHASRGKQVRAEPISVVYEHGRGYHVGSFEQLEDEMCTWLPGNKSPNRLDAMVWAASYLVKSTGGGLKT